MAIKVKDLEDLLDQLNEDVNWRKHELSNMKAMIDMSERPDYLLRAGFVMLCAHFEGFIRYSSNAYIAFISSQRHKTAELKSSFSAITLRFHKHNLFSTTGEKVKTSVVRQLIEEYHELLSQEFLIKVSDDNIPFIDEDSPTIQTDSNPSSSVLKEISSVLCLDYEALFQSRAPFIDGELLNPRNQIAHGRRRPIRYESYIEAYDYVFTIMDEYLDAIINEANAKSYLAS